MPPDAMTVRLHLYRIRVVKVVSDLPERLEVVIKDLCSVVRCPFCGFRTTKVHETKRKRIKDLPVSGRKVTLIWLRRRFTCDNCSERHTEAHPMIEGKITIRLGRAIVKDATQLSVTEITRRYGLSWHSVMALNQDVVGPPREAAAQEVLPGPAGRRDFAAAPAPLRHPGAQR